MAGGNKRGRKPGSRNRFPAHEKVFDELLRHNFDYLKEHVELFRRIDGYVDKCAEPESAAHFFALQIRWFASFHEFVFPKRRPEDAKGLPENGDAKVSENTEKEVIRLLKVADAGK